MDGLCDVLSNDDRSKFRMLGPCNDDDGGLGNYELVDNLVRFKYKGNFTEISVDSFHMKMQICKCKYDKCQGEYVIKEKKNFFFLKKLYYYD